MATRPLAVAALVLAGACAAEVPAAACENAVQLSSDERIRMLQDAEAALDEGEVERARELASRVKRHGARFELGESDGTDRVSMRAERIIALSYVRDPDADRESQEYALRTLVERRVASKSPDPILDADYAEALSRIPGRHDEAYAILAPLAKKDLLGSPNALGALHRVAKERGDEATATAAKAGCEGMIGTSPICRGDYPRPPLIRGTARSYLPHALLALAALAYRLLRSRRVARGAATAPWIGHAAPLQALALLAGGFYVFARATYPTWTTIVFAAILLLTLAVERRAFFAAVRRGLVAGLVLRAAGPADDHLPSLALLRAPREAHTLERDHGGGAQPGYREAARTPLLRLERRRIPDRVGFALVTVLALIALVILLGVFATLRGGS